LRRNFGTLFVQDRHIPFRNDRVFRIKKAPGLATRKKSHNDETPPLATSPKKKRVVRHHRNRNHIISDVARVSQTGSGEDGSERKVIVRNKHKTIGNKSEIRKSPHLRSVESPLFVSAEETEDDQAMINLRSRRKYKTMLLSAET
jgi:hypothetical protein